MVFNTNSPTCNFGQILNFLDPQLYLYVKIKCGSICVLPSIIVGPGYVDGIIFFFSWHQLSLEFLLTSLNFIKLSINYLLFFFNIFKQEWQKSFSFLSWGREMVELKWGRWGSKNQVNEGKSSAKSILCAHILVLSQMLTHGVISGIATAPIDVLATHRNQNNLFS